MVLILTPQNGSFSPVCSGVDAYNAERAGKSTSLQTVNLFLFWICVGIPIAYFPFLWKARHKRYFRTVRTPASAVCCYLGMTLINVCCFLNYTYRLPCIVLTGCWVIGMTLFTFVDFSREITFIAEVAYATRFRNNQLNIAGGGGEDYESEISTQSSLLSASLIWKRVKLILRVCLGEFDYEDTTRTTLEEIATVKQHGIKWLSMFIGCISVVSFSVLIAVVPPLRSCTECDWFLELMLTVFIIFLVFAIIPARSFRRHYWSTSRDAVAKQDEQKMEFEQKLKLPLVVVGTVILVLVLTDPGSLARNNVFNWSMLLGLNTFNGFFIYFMLPYYHQWKHHRSVKSAQAHRNLHWSPFPKTDGPAWERWEIRLKEVE